MLCPFFEEAESTGLDFYGKPSQIFNFQKSGPTNVLDIFEINQKSLLQDVCCFY
jgi:hypothetical protein